MFLPSFGKYKRKWIHRCNKMIIQERKQKTKSINGPDQQANIASSSIRVPPIIELYADPMQNTRIPYSTETAFSWVFRFFFFFGFSPLFSSGSTTDDPSAEDKPPGELGNCTDEPSWTLGE